MILTYYTGQTGSDRIATYLDFGALSTTAYASGDALFDQLQVINAGRYYGGTGIINRLMLMESSTGALKSPHIKAYIYGANYNANQQDAFVNDGTDALNLLIGVIDLPKVNWVNQNGMNVIYADVNLPFGLYELSTSLYIVLTVHENVTFNATHSITGKLVLQRD